LENELGGKRARRDRRERAVREYKKLEEVVAEKNLDFRGCINGVLIAHDKIGNSLKQESKMQRIQQAVGQDVGSG
jgi:hypothetical protein